jgi:hypothetical protein
VPASRVGQHLKPAGCFTQLGWQWQQQFSRCKVAGPAGCEYQVPTKSRTCRRCCRARKSSLASVPPCAAMTSSAASHVASQ